MGRPKIRSLGALAAVLGAAVFLLVVREAREPGDGEAGRTRADAPAGPELLLLGVEVREIPKEGPQHRMLSDRASYEVLARRISADNVTLYLPGSPGEMVVRSPKASWDMNAGRILLPEGGDAGNGAGWSAAVSAASFSLKDRVMTAEGIARLSGPGIRVSGDNLVWGWREGKLSLSNATTRVESPGTFRGKR